MVGVPFTGGSNIGRPSIEGPALRGSFLVSLSLDASILTPPFLALTPTYRGENFRNTPSVGDTNTPRVGVGDSIKKDKKIPRSKESQNPVGNFCFSMKTRETGSVCCNQSGICIGSERALALPALRTVLAVLPHTALQSVVSSSGLARLHIGFMKGEKPLCREEGIRPALMVLAACVQSSDAYAVAARSPEVVDAQSRRWPETSKTARV